MGALVQKATNTDFSGVTSANKAFTSDVTSGNVMVASVMFGAASTFTPTITDSQGNTWSAGETTSDTSSRITYVFYASVGSSGANTVTATFNGTVSEGSLDIFEFSGYSATKNSSSSLSGSTSSDPSITLVTTGANSLIFAAISNSGGSATAGTGFTLGFQPTNFSFASDEYKLDSGAAGSQSVTFTSPGGTINVAMVAIELAAASAAITTGRGKAVL